MYHPLRGGWYQLQIFRPTFVPDVTGSAACHVSGYPVPSGLRFSQKIAFPLIGLNVMPSPVPLALAVSFLGAVSLAPSPTSSVSSSP